MEEGIEGMDDLKNLFEKILGSNITLKDTMEVNEESVFCLIVNFH